ncbi:MAG: CDC27 family protein [Bacteroidota bacterium]
MEPNSTSDKSKWYERLAWLSLVLFSIFWSVDPFFFWTLLGVSMAFWFFAFYYSDVKISIFNSPPKQANFRQPYGTAGSSPSSLPPDLTRKIIRTIIIIAGSFIFFLFVVGIFSGNNDDTSTEVASEPEKQTSVTNTNDNPSFMDRGIDFFNNGDYDSAIFYYDKVLQFNSDDVDGIYNKALVYYMKKDYRKSISLVKKSVRLSPDYNTGWWLLGDDYYSMNQYDSAMISLEKAYNNNYNEPGFLELLGDTYLKKDNRSKAKEMYLKVIEQDTTDADVYRHLAELDPSNAIATGRGRLLWKKQNKMHLIHSLR